MVGVKKVKKHLCQQKIKTFSFTLVLGTNFKCKFPQILFKNEIVIVQFACKFVEVILWIFEDNFNDFLIVLKKFLY